MKTNQFLFSALMMMLFATFSFAQINEATKTAKLTPIHDAYLAGKKGVNSDVIQVANTKSTGYLMFDLSAINGKIKSATLTLKCAKQAGNGNIKINLGNSTKWKETKLRVKNKPAPLAQLASLNKKYKVGKTYSWDLNAAQLKGGKVSLIVSQVSGSGVSFGSKENPANKPVLHVTYTTSGGGGTGGGGQNCKHYTEINGLVVMEAENTKSALGQWKKSKDVKGFSGSGHIEFTGNKPSSGAAKSPLTYTFTINQAGDYRLLLRAHKRLAGAAPDHCNDAYVKVSGDYTTGKGGAPIDLLKNNNKFFGGAAGGWGWAQQIDKNHKKYHAIYRFKAGKTYTLTISGRSQRFNIDRILFYKTSIPMNQAKAATKETKDCRKSDFEQVSLSNSINVYPNPALHTVNLDVNGATDVKIFNMQGKLVYSEILNSSTTISTSELGNAGLYFIKANDQSFKLIVK